MQVVCRDSQEESLANINDKKFFIEVTSIKGRKTRIEMKDRIFLLNNLSPSTKYKVGIREESDHMKRLGLKISELERRVSSCFSSQTQTLLVETLALPSEMVAESVVNNIGTGGGRDNSVGDDELILQLVIALSVGEYTASWNRISNNY